MFVELYIILNLYSQLSYKSVLIEQMRCHDTIDGYNFCIYFSVYTFIFIHLKAVQ